MTDLVVSRWCKWDPSMESMTGDFLCVGGVELDLRVVVAIEYEYAKAEHPENPAFNMRPMFYTGSPYGAEILKLAQHI